MSFPSHPSFSPTAVLPWVSSPSSMAPRMGYVNPRILTSNLEPEYDTVFAQYIDTTKCMSESPIGSPLRGFPLMNPSMDRLLLEHLSTLTASCAQPPFMNPGLSNSNAFIPLSGSTVGSISTFRRDGSDEAVHDQYVTAVSPLRTLGRTPCTPTAPYPHIAPPFSSSLSASSSSSSSSASSSSSSSSAGSLPSSATSSPCSPSAQLPSSDSPPTLAPSTRARNIQVSEFIDAEDLMDVVNLRCLVPGCTKFNKSKNKKATAADLKRHVLTHNRKTWYGCIGVPIDDAKHLDITDAYLIDGKLMVGGCREMFSRADALKRHIHNKVVKGQPCLHDQKNRKRKLSIKVAKELLRWKAVAKTRGRR